MYQLSVSENADMSKPRTYSVSGTEYDVYNFRPETRYYWTVSTAGATSNIATFKTENELPYNIFVDGVTNVRDCGGKITQDGGRVRYGMMYRSGQLNDFLTEAPYITPDGVKTMRDELGVRFEIDLRAMLFDEDDPNARSVLGDDIKYVNAPMGNTNGTDDELNFAALRKIFRVLADENNYPLVYHCAIGTDRTGYLAYLTNGLLGVSDNELFRDYLFSDFGAIGSGRTADGICYTYPMTLKGYAGATLSEKIYNYLSEVVGVPTQQLDKFISIMKEYPEEKPVRIFTAAEFAAMKPNGSYVLAADITVNTTYSAEFTGTFDGAGHTITVSKPLFEKFSGTVKKLTISGNIENNNGGAAALALSSDGMSAYGVMNKAYVTGRDYAAGLVGKADGKNVYFTDCENKGNITASGIAAGIIAFCKSPLAMRDCINSGDIQSLANDDCGGIVGDTFNWVQLEKCFNFGNISGCGEYTSGIAANMTALGYNLKTLSACANYGSVYSTGKNASGIVGYIDADGGSMTYCYNVGDVKCTNAEGIAAGLITNCYDLYFTVANCYNTGNITAPAAYLQLFYNRESYDVEYLFEGETGYIYDNYCRGDISTPAFAVRSYRTDLPDSVYADEKSPYARPFAYAEVLDGTLCEKLNAGKKGTYKQFNHHPAIIDRVNAEIDSFDDVKPNTWYTSAALWCNAKGYITGTSPTAFAPNNILTRAQFVQILVKVNEVALDLIPYTARFTDVPEGKWYTKAVMWCVYTGVTGGTSATTFSPDAPVTREQLSTFFYAFAKNRELDISASADLSKYTDSGDISPWAKTAVEWAVAEGLISGMSATTLSPKTVTTRAQAAVIFKNFVENLFYYDMI